MQNSYHLGDFPLSSKRWICLAISISEACLSSYMPVKRAAPEQLRKWHCLRPPTPQTYNYCPRFKGSLGRDGKRLWSLHNGGGRCHIAAENVREMSCSRPVATTVTCQYREVKRLWPDRVLKTQQPENSGHRGMNGPRWLAAHPLCG